MASGDIKDVENCIVMTVISASAVAVGDVVHLVIASGKWATCTTSDPGKLGVALDAASGVDITIRVLVWGEVEVKATAAVIAKGALVVAGTTGFVVDAGTLSATTVVGTILGTAMTAFASGGQGIIFVGLM